jgi:hypothetical protein
MEAYKGSKLLVTGTGNVTDEVWVEYIKRQTPPKLDDNQDRLCPPNGGPNPALSRNSKPPPFRRWSVHNARYRSWRNASLSRNILDLDFGVKPLPGILCRLLFHLNALVRLVWSSGGQDLVRTADPLVQQA